MPKIIIDDREIEVAAGTKVIEAAEQLGIMIPRFCYHPALGPVGACRVCAVKFLQGPFKGVQMSCMVDAKDDMVVSTTDTEAVEFRKYVIEWLMLHHPHDCPVCDEGGHCLLQDMTVSGGHGIRRYLGKKRTYADQYLGPLLQHEMNRCIHCYRCSRFYQEFCGYRDLGAMQAGNRTYFGRFREGILQSPFCGNLSDICPTGVYTDKPSRFIGRRWDYQRSPSLCINCSLGCHTVVSARYREVVRQEAGFSPAVNGHFICDRGRYGFFYASHPQRPRKAKIDDAETTSDRAIAVLKQRLSKITHMAGAGAIACAGSSRNSLETQAMLQRVCQLNGWQLPCYFADRATTQKVKSAITRLTPELRVSLREIESADFIVLLGADPVNEAPMLALAMRQARRNNAAIAVIDPRPVFLPFEFEHLPVNLDAVNRCLNLLIKAALDESAVRELDGSAPEFYAALAENEQMALPHQEKIAALAEKLRGSQRPIIVCATETVRPQTPSLAANHALLLNAVGKQAGLFYLMPGANAFAAGLFSDADASFETLVEDIANGSVKGLILVESNPFWHFADRQRLEQALDRLELLVVIDYLNSAAARKAHIFLPAKTVFETGGVFINQEGRAQNARQAHTGGIPIAQTGGGDHPPRVYGSGIPGSAFEAAWQVLAHLIDAEQQPNEKKQRADIWNWLAETDTALAELATIDEFPEDGIYIHRPQDVAARFSAEGLRGGAGHGNRLELIAVDWTFGTEELSAYSACLKELEVTPCIFISRSDAQKMKLTDADRVSIELAGGTIEAKLHVADHMAAGTLVMPRHKALDWQKMHTGQTWVRKSQIRKV